jgi:ABC-2 type transport system permease protein
LGVTGYIRVLYTFLRNSLVREMTFRANFIIQIITRAFWFFAQVTLFEVIYGNVNVINGWTREEYFAFMATGMLINAIVETFFMPNCANFSELIRTGNLDFALLKPIDTQFLISFEKVNLAMLNQVVLALGLLAYALTRIGEPISMIQVGIYFLYVAIGVAFFYSLMITLAATSVWLGRNQGLYDFWFYITIFARYPREIYNGRKDSVIEGADVLQFAFTYVVPILLVVTVPAKALVKTVEQPHFFVVGAIGAVVGLVVSRFTFKLALKSYRSASS